MSLLDTSQLHRPTEPVPCFLLKLGVFEQHGEVSASRIFLRQHSAEACDEVQMRTHGGRFRFGLRREWSASCGLAVPAFRHAGYGIAAFEDVKGGLSLLVREPDNNHSRA